VTAVTPRPPKDAHKIGGNLELLDGNRR